LVQHTLAPVHNQLPQLAIIWHSLYALAVFGLSVLLTWMMAQIPGVRHAVMR
jgi:hypothetical protein